MTVQADSPSIHLTFIDGEVEVVNRNTFLDVDVLSPDSREELRRTKSCPALQFFHDEMHDGLQSPDIMDSKHWARLITDSTQSTEFRDSDSVAEFDMNLDAPNCDSPNEEGVEPGDEGVDWQSVHTVMIKNIPCRCSTEEVLAAVDQMGFEGSYDFFYLPMNRRHRQGIGYAFINFQEKGTAAVFKDAMCGYQFPGRNSKKVVHVAVAQLQGRQEVDAYFSRTQVMHTRYRPVMS
mmetsp:Transcript_24121/g.39295  ORF Transcript_24121/g.39295 Transcript_24121/m.39295 type:complete len:235 (-) Transcript_24121:24-728(-)